MIIRLLGLDPGFANVGYAVVELSAAGEKVVDLGLIRTEKADKKRAVLAADDNLRRAQEISQALEDLRGQFGFKTVCAESMSFPRNASAAAKMSMAWGAVAAWTQFQNLAVVQASPQEVKRAVCGKKDASKAEIQETLIARYSIERSATHVAKTYQEHPFDALASVVACLDSQVVRSLRALAS